MNSQRRKQKQSDMPSSTRREQLLMTSEISEHSSTSTVSPTNQDETDVASGGINNDSRVDKSYDDEGEDHDDEASLIEVDVTSIEVKTNSDHMSQSGDFEAQALLFHIKSRDEYLTSFPTPESWDALTAAAQTFFKRKWNTSFLQRRPDVDTKSLEYYNTDVRNIRDVVERTKAKEIKATLQAHVKHAFSNFQLNAYCNSPIQEVANAAVEKRDALANANAVEAAEARKARAALPFPVRTLSIYFFMF